MATEFSDRLHMLSLQFLRKPCKSCCNLKYRLAAIANCQILDLLLSLDESTLVGKGERLKGKGNVEVLLPFPFTPFPISATSLFL